MHNHNQLKSEWSLFLDRDGVINKRLVGDYVKTPEEFEFLPGSIAAIRILSAMFKNIFIITNQQGIGKGIMTVKQLDIVHRQMLGIIKQNHGRIDRVFYCPDLASKDKNCRKPGLGMAQMTKKEFPSVDFTKSYMVGDSASDIEFGQNAEMHCVYIQSSPEDNTTFPNVSNFSSLFEFANHLKSL